MPVIVHEGVAGLGVLLYVVGDEGALQGLLQLIGDALLPLGQAAVAADDGAGGLEEVLEIRRKLAAVVDAGGREAVAGDEQQGESAAHAEADDADFAVAVGLGQEPAARGFDVVEGGSRTGHQVAHDRAEAEKKAAPVVEVDGEGKEAGLGQPIGLVAVIPAHAEDVVKDDDAGHGAGGGRNGELSGHLAARSWDEDVGHGRSRNIVLYFLMSARFYSRSVTGV